MKNAKTSGVWGAVAEAAGPYQELASALIKELEEGLDLLGAMDPAVTFFGGARILPDDPYYAAAAAMGERLADAGIPPRTGAGPGIMAAVPDGFRSRADKNGASEHGRACHEVGRGPQALTQGFNIVLPFEQAVNPSIDISMELAHFPTRKLMLYKNALGLVIFPGGFGTLDELLEVWRLKVSGDLNFPVVLFGTSFWKPLGAALRAMASVYPSAAIAEEIYGLVSLTDDPDEAIAYITDAEKTRSTVEPLEKLGSRIARELVEGLEYLETLAPAVTVLGGSRLQTSDKAIADAEVLARQLAVGGVPTRATVSGQLSVALARGGHQGDEYLPQQAFGMRRRDARNLYGADRVHLVNDRLTHKVLLTEGSRALVALPGGLGTLDELFSVLCQLQTRKVSSRRIILLGRTFWTPLLDVIRQQMLDGPRQTISAADLELLELTDDP
ncbi:MAG: LOG family protein, partial [Bradymonadaceae bacterium]